MKNTNAIFEQRKVKDNFIIEVWTYDISESKDGFFEHYKAMQKRSFKNDRTKDEVKGNILYVTYTKNILANTTKKAKKGRD